MVDGFTHMLSAAKNSGQPLEPVGEPGLRIYHGIGLEQLTDALADSMYPFPDDPFVPEVIVIPNIGMGDWIQREVPDALGRRVSRATGRAVPGILANFHVLTTHSFTNFILNGKSREFDSRWSRSRLLWFVHRAIDDVGRDQVPGAADNRIRIADEVADLFDRYITHRPSMLQYWRDGRATDGIDPMSLVPESMRWQTKVFARVCELIGEFSAMDALTDLRRQLDADEVPEYFPTRISVFGFSTLNPGLRILLDVVAQKRLVNVFILHPAAGEWERTIGSRDQLQVRSKDLDTTGLHPLVARWGRIALELRDLVPSASLIELPPPEPVSTLLGRLQHSLGATGSSPSAISVLRSLEDEDGKRALALGDGTLQVHACHGRARQVEVLRDALLHQLNDDPTLHVHDILIVCPELDQFAPIIPAIFHSGEGAKSTTVPALDVRVTETNMAGEAPVVEAFLALMKMASSRCGVADVLGLLSRPIVRRQFDIDEVSMERLLEMADVLRIRFGIDGEHRSQWGTPAALEVGTWRFSLKRLMMGLAVASPDPLLGPGGVVPFDDVSVNDAPLIGSLAEFVAQLESFVDFAAAPHSMSTWLSQLMVAVEAMTWSHDADSGLFELKAIFDDIESYSLDAGIDSQEKFDLAEVMTLIRSHLGTRSARPQFRSGAITVSRLPPVLGVPYRVIAVLGASEAMFAASGSSGDDVLMLRPCLGEPSPSVWGRLALLNLISSARDAFIVTCEGADINTNREIPLAVPIQELLEAAAAHVDEGDEGRQRIFVRHPRQNFDPSTMTKGLVFDDAPFTFDAGSKRAYVRRQQALREDLQVAYDEEKSRSLPAKREARILTSDTLHQVLINPVKWFTTNVLQMRLESAREGAVPDVLELQADALLVSQTSRDLIEKLRRTPEFLSGGDMSSVSQIWREATINSGLFPPGQLGAKQIDSLFDEVSMFLASLPRRYFDQSIYRSVDVRVDVSSIQLTNTGPLVIEGSIGNVVDSEVVRINYKRYKEIEALTGAFDLALLTLSNPDAADRVVLLNRGKNAQSPSQTKTVHIRGAGLQERLDNARRLVAMAVDLARCAGESLVPVFPRASLELARGRTKAARDAFDDDDLTYDSEIKYFFGSKTWDDVIAESVLPSDPPGQTVHRAQRYAHFIWRTFDETVTLLDVKDEQDQL